MGAPKSVLIVEDNEDQRAALTLMLSNWGYRTETARDGQEAIEKFPTFPADLVVTDLAMPRVDGAGLLRWLNEQDNPPPTIVATAFGDINKAVSMVHELGAFWFLEKPIDFDTLRVLLERAANQSSLAQEKDRLQRRLAYSGVLGELAGCSAGMQHLFALIQQVAPTTAPVLITGESGTGKELVAQTIHRLSHRRDGPFVAVNCAALPETLIESELFGHEKGSFTGAVERRAGCFELAQRGTLLLDEIGEMHPGTQAKLLRVLEDSRVRRLGAKAELRVDVRVLAATNKDPAVAISKGQLRQDLFFRLSVFHLPLLPLREHKEDMPLIIDTLLPELNKKHSCRVTGLDPDVLDRLQRHDWPGNVRELRNILERAVIVAEESMITVAHLPADFVAAQADCPAEVRPGERPADSKATPLRVGMTLADAEKHLILKTLENTGNNKTRTALILGISLKTLHNKLKRYAAEPAEQKV